MVVESQELGGNELVDVSSIIQNLLGKYSISAYEINNGQCDEFAYALMSYLPRGAFTVEGEGDLPGHTFVKYRERYYDAEAPEGVLDPIELPIYARVHKRYPTYRLVTNEIASKYFDKKYWK